MARSTKGSGGRGAGGRGAGGRGASGPGRGAQAKDNVTKKRKQKVLFFSLLKCIYSYGIFDIILSRALTRVEFMSGSAGRCPPSSGGPERRGIRCGRGRYGFRERPRGFHGCFLWFKNYSGFQVRVYAHPKLAHNTQPVLVDVGASRRVEDVRKEA